ncbi:P-loop containing nucleoside triphosphate hydrolase [Brevundimonas phage vB_BpoS-Kikimora]|uniref:P-loop containing nucleoside triphosphate hydrolase n=1 Tax=Brevundimonas phage vB_BpoS-Kikimora TaxID=2948601 RepID=A0A9E7MT26_9CAUD|nr:P-loop containing nucleoside triphosphate hydrolase [Brevundimonas phage vB_BpoS-Kikimora]
MTDNIARVTVTVTGDKGSGKTTLIAVLAQALAGAGHDVTVPEGTPSASRAISDLTRRYQVDFLEASPTALEQAHQRIAELEAKIAAASRASIQPAPGGVYTFQEAEDIITRAMTYLSDAVKLEMSREDTREEFNRVRTKMATLRHEADARRVKATAMLRGVLTGTPEAPARPADTEHTQAVAAARRMSASDRLKLANGARPMTTDEQTVAALLDEDTRRIADEMVEDTLGSSK